MATDRWHKRVNGRKVKSKEYGTGNRWQARWRDANGNQRAKNFPTEDAAKAHEARMLVSPATPPPSGRKMAEQYGIWIASKAARKPATLASYRQKWRLYVGPRWGHVSLARVRHSDVAAWLAEIAATKSSTTARQCWTVVHGVIASAVKDGILPADPLVDMPLPRAPREDLDVLTPAEVSALVHHGGALELAIETLAVTGIRWGEMAALNVADVDPVRRRIRISKSASLTEGYEPILVPTKTGADRWVPITQDLADRLTAGRTVVSEPLFRTTYGKRWRYSSFARQWAAVCDRAGVRRCKPHLLRHTAISWALANGATLKQAQAMAGHASATLTADRYGHLLGDSGMDELASKLRAQIVHTDPESCTVVHLRKYAKST